MTSTAGNVISLIPIVFAVNVLGHITVHALHESKIVIYQVTGNVANAYNWLSQGLRRWNGIILI